jgi:hypothetical protein
MDDMESTTATYVADESGDFKVRVKAQLSTML